MQAALLSIHLLFPIHSFIHPLINILQTLNYIPGIEKGTGEIKMTKGGHRVYINWII